MYSLDLCCQYVVGRFHRKCACKEQHWMDWRVNQGILDTSRKNLGCPILVQHQEFSEIKRIGIKIFFGYHMFEFWHPNLMQLAYDFYTKFQPYVHMQKILDAELENLDSSLMCPVCLDLLFNPFDVVPCMHTFCEYIGGRFQRKCACKEQHWMD